MVHMLAYENKTKELQGLIETVRELIAYYSEDKWQVSGIDSMEMLEEFFATHPVLDLACYDVSISRNIDYLRMIRRNGYAKTILMLLADENMSPMEYIRPEILASELLIKPYTMNQLRDKLRDFLSYYVTSISKNVSQEMFVIETKEGKTRIPYDHIYFFEAREKKIYATTYNAAFPFYGTLDEIEKQLPKQFVRCHRSFIVNWNLVERIGLSEWTIYLANSVSVAFSRTYKDKIKALR